MKKTMHGFKDYFSTASDAYRHYRPRYPSALFDYLADIAPARDWAWDCGCGNGQASAALAQRFEQVTATDASAEQIKQAQSAPNIDYHVAPAETIDAAPQSLDLITVAQALHWFDRDAFFARVDKCLKPGGVLAVWCYQLFQSTAALDEAIEVFYANVVGPYWPPERDLVIEGYESIQFPYPRRDTPAFTMQCDWSFQHLIGYLKTWSAVKRYTQDRQVDPVEQCFERLQHAWGDPAARQTVTWPLAMYVGQKPATT